MQQQYSALAWECTRGILARCNTRAAETSGLFVEPTLRPTKYAQRKAARIALGTAAALAAAAAAVPRPPKAPRQKPVRKSQPDTPAGVVQEAIRKLQAQTAPSSSAAETEARVAGMYAALLAITGAEVPHYARATDCLDKALRRAGVGKDKGAEKVRLIAEALSSCRKTLCQALCTDAATATVPVTFARYAAQTAASVRGSWPGVMLRVLCLLLGGPDPCPHTGIVELLASDSSLSVPGLLCLAESFSPGFLPHEVPTEHAVLVRLCLKRYAAVSLAQLPNTGGPRERDRLLSLCHYSAGWASTLRPIELLQTETVDLASRWLNAARWLYARDTDALTAGYRVDHVTATANTLPPPIDPQDGAPRVGGGEPRDQLPVTLQDLWLRTGTLSGHMLVRALCFAFRVCAHTSAVTNSTRRIAPEWMARLLLILLPLMTFVGVQTGGKVPDEALLPAVEVWRDHGSRILAKNAVHAAAVAAWRDISAGPSGGRELFEDGYYAGPGTGCPPLGAVRAQGPLGEAVVAALARCHDDVMRGLTAFSKPATRATKKLLATELAVQRAICAPPPDLMALRRRNA